jgi:hypothetical protein
VQRVVVVEGTTFICFHVDTGAVYCLAGVHIANLAVNWSELTRNFWNHWTILFLVCSLLAVESFETYTNRNDSISYAAHYGGFGCGVILGIIFLRNPCLKCHEKYVCIPIAVVAALIGIGGGTVWVFSHWPPKFVTNDFVHFNMLTPGTYCTVLKKHMFTGIFFDYNLESSATNHVVGRLQTATRFMKPTITTSHVQRI